MEKARSNTCVACYMCAEGKKRASVHLWKGKWENDSVVASEKTTGNGGGGGGGDLSYLLNDHALSLQSLHNISF